MEEQISASGGEAICSIGMTGTEGYPYHPSAVSWMLYPVTVMVSDELTPSVYPVVHPFDRSVSNYLGESWAVVLFFAATWLTGYTIVYRGRAFLGLPVIVAMFVLAIAVFVSRV
jgi:hypothetical protein